MKRWGRCFRSLLPGELLGNQRGLALLVVLWVLAVLTVIVAQYSYGVRNEINSTRNFRDDTQAYYLARAGIYWGIQRLLQEKQSTEEKPLLRGTPFPAESFGTGAFTLFVADLSGRINLNLATPELLYLLSAGLDLDEKTRKALVDSIEDWRDEDSLHRLLGAEDDYYQALPEPYHCGDGPFLAREDLLLVKGVSKKLYQTMQQRITVLPIKTDSSPSSKKRRRYMTNQWQDSRQSVEKRMQPQSQININSAPAAVLRCLPSVEPIAVEALLERRKEGGFRAMSEVIETLGQEASAELIRFITLKSSDYYSITSVGSLPQSEGSHTVTAIVHLDRGKQRYTIVSWRDNAVMK